MEADQPDEVAGDLVVQRVDAALHGLEALVGPMFETAHGLSHLDERM